MSVPRISSLVGLLEARLGGGHWEQWCHPLASVTPKAYARLTIYHMETNQLLCDAVVAREKDLAPALIIQEARLQA